MRSIAVTKPDMGVLSRERLLLSPFGTLAQAFAEELLARAEQEEGAWPRVPLDLLEEGETAPAPAAPANVTLQVDLRLALEALRREGDRTEQRQAAERIVERVLQIQSRREQPQSRPDRVSGPAVGGPRPLTVLGTVRQEFHQHLTQNIHITQSLPQGSDPHRQREPGGLARQAEAFSRQLQTLREEGAAFPRESGSDQGRVHVSKLPERVPAAGRTDLPKGEAAPLPPEALALLEEQGERTARNAESAGQAVLHQTGKQLRGLLDEALRPPVERPAAPGDSALKENRTEVPPPFPVELSHRTEPEGEETSAPAPQTGETRKSGAEKPAAGRIRRQEAEEKRSAGRVRQSAGERPPADKERPAGETEETLPGVHRMTTSARDIRVGPEVRAAAPDDARPETAGRGTEMTPQPPVELSYRTEPEGEETSAPAPQTGETRQSGAEKPAAGGIRRQEAEEERSAGRVRQKAGKQSPADHAGQHAGERPPADKERSAGETAGTLPGVHRMTTSARDIRVGPEVRAAAPESARPETAPGAEMTPQPPVELSHRTEAEGGEAAASAPQTGETRKSGAEKPAAGRTRRQEAEEKRSAGRIRRQETEEERSAGRVRRQETEEERSAGRVRQSTGEQPPADKERPAGETAGTLSGVHRMTTSARDIRVGPEVRAAAPESARPETAGRGTGMTPQPPVELSHRTEAESEETSALAPQTGETRKSGAEKPAAGGIRRQETEEERFAGRVRQSAGERPPADKERPAGETAGTLPGVHRLTTSARDIRVGSEARAAVPENAWPETADRGAEMIPQPPVELSHRTEPEGGEAATSAPQTGETRKSGAEKPAAGRTRRQEAGEERSAGRARQSAGERPPADKERPAGETAGTLPGVHRLTTSARDIRTRPGTLQGSRISSGGLPDQTTVPETERPAEQYLPPAEMDLNLSGSTGTGAFPADVSAPRTEIAETGEVRNSWANFQPEPLTYASGQPAPAQQTGGSGQPGTEESDYVRSLPDWARRFLQDGPPRGQSAQTMRVARNIASLPQPAAEDSIQWTAPAYRPPEAPMAYREKEPQDQTREAGEIRISDAEIRRAADKVYHMIEERIRRERRRLGL